MVSISLCMIVKDEEAVLDRCLTSVSDLVDEIIIVDTGSVDTTKEIAKKYTDKLYDFEWIHDFSAARNYSFSKATKEYIFHVDADDVMFEEDRQKFKKMKETLDNSIDYVTMIYNYGFDQHGNVSFSHGKISLVKREKNFKWEGKCHNLLRVHGNKLQTDIKIAHDKLKSRSDRNLKIYQNRLENGDKFDVRDIFYYANELYDHHLYEEALLFYNKLFDMKEGWFENKIYACTKVADYYVSIKDYDNAFRYAFKTFSYALPRAEACCTIGKLFMKQNKLDEAIYWYKFAAQLEKPKDKIGFYRDGCWSWIPLLQLCVCYDKLGDHKTAFLYNEKARKCAPNNGSVLENIKYFKKLGYKNK